MYSQKSQILICKPVNSASFNSLLEALSCKLPLGALIALNSFFEELPRVDPMCLPK
jgi:hypothetical protein